MANTSTTELTTKKEMADLFEEFIESPETGMFKDLIDLFKTVDKNIKGFNEFLQAKAYKKRYPDRDDKQRYDDMITTSMNYIRDTNSIDKYLLNSVVFFESLIYFLASDEVYETTSEPFLKGSFKTICEKVARIFKPKDDDEPYVGFSAVLNNVKQYSLTFPENFRRVFSKPECRLYSVTTDVTNIIDSESLLKSLIYTLCGKNFVFLAAVKGVDDAVTVDTVTDPETTETTSKIMTVLVASLVPIVEYEQSSISAITVDDFLSQIDTGSFKPVYIDNFISLHSLKRLFVAKNKDTTQEFTELLNVLGSRHGAHFYVADYVDMSSFNLLPEDNLPNVLKGIVKSGEDYAGPSKEHPHGVLASFQMNGSTGDLQIKSYWLSVEPIEDCVPQFDREAFNWTPITAEEYLTHMKLQGELCTEYLH